MAGIGQRYTSDSHVTWNSQHPLNMGRSLIPDSSKPLIPFDKRSMLNSSTTSNSPIIPTSTPVIGTPSSNMVTNGGSMLDQGQNDLSSSMFNLRLTTSVASQRNGPDFSSGMRANFVNSNANNGKNSESSSILSSFNNSTNLNGFPPSSSNRILNEFSASNFISGSNNALTVTSTNNKSLLQHQQSSQNLQQSSTNPRIIAPSNPAGNNNNSMVFSILDPSEFPPIRSQPNSSSSSSFNQKSVGGGPSSLNFATNSQQSQHQPKNFLFATTSSVVVGGTNPSSSSSLSASNLGKGSLMGAEMNGHHHATNGPEFSIDQDFPALPGSSAAMAAANSSNSNIVVSSNPSGGTTGNGGHVNAISHSLHQSAAAVVNNTTLNNNAALSLTDIPKNMITDKFGMIGLLKLIRVGDHDATLNMLAPGLDLNSLNIKWDTSEEMFNTFVSPCHDSSTGRAQDIDYPVPSEYLIHQIMSPDHLPDPPMEKLAESTLFWLFYNCCREEIQLVAARELYQRHWRFHTKKQIWLTRVTNENVTVDTTSEQGFYHYWDRMNAQKIKSHMKIYYSELDDAPASFRLSSGLLSASVRLDVN